MPLGIHGGTGFRVSLHVLTWLIGPGVVRKSRARLGPHLEGRRDKLAAMSSHQPQGFLPYVKMRWRNRDCCYCTNSSMCPQKLDGRESEVFTMGHVCHAVFDDSRCYLDDC